MIETFKSYRICLHQSKKLAEGEVSTNTPGKSLLPASRLSGHLCRALYQAIRGTTLSGTPAFNACSLASAVLITVQTGDGPFVGSLPLRIPNLRGQ